MSERLATPGIIGVQLRTPSQHYRIEDSKWALSQAPIVPRDASLLDNGCIFIPVWLIELER